MKNLNAGTDLLQNVGLDGMPVAGKLWLILIEEVEAEIGPTDTLATLTQAVATEIAVTGRTCVNRIIDLGGPHTWPEIVGAVGAVLVVTDDPDTPGALGIAAEDVNAGSALDLSVSGPYTASSFSFKVAFQDEP